MSRDERRAERKMLGMRRMEKIKAAEAMRRVYL